MLFEALSARTTTYFLCIEDEHLFAFLSLNTFTPDYPFQTFLNIPSNPQAENLCVNAPRKSVFKDKKANKCSSSMHKKYVVVDICLVDSYKKYLENAIIKPMDSQLIHNNI
jgi:hypothetical protein